MDRVKGEHPLSEKQRVNVTLGKYGGNIIEICVAQINSRRARLVTRERERGYLSDGVEFPIRSKAFVQLFSPRWKESLIFLVGGEGRYQGEGTNRRLELSDTRYCETSPLMARPETALQDEREHEPENRWGLSTFASSRELAQLATRFRYLLRDLAIRNLDNRPIFNVSTCVCIFDVKQGSRGEIFRKLYFLSFLCTFHFSTKLQLITNILPRIDTSYCYDLQIFSSSLFFYINISFVFPSTIERKVLFPIIPRCKREGNYFEPEDISYLRENGKKRSSISFTAK